MSRIGPCGVDQGDRSGPSPPGALFSPVISWTWAFGPGPMHVRSEGPAKIVDGEVNAHPGNPGERFPSLRHREEGTMLKFCRETASLIAALALITIGVASAEADWKPARPRLMTEWGEKVSPDNAWREYPRPQFVRERWQNLNGLWDYAIAKRTEPQPAK